MDDAKKRLLRENEITDEKVNKYKWIYPAVIALLCVIFIAGIGYGLVAVLQIEGSDPPAVLEEGLTPAPQTKAEAADYLNSVLKKALEEKPAFSANERFRIDEDSIETDGGDALLATLKYIRSGFEDSLDGSFGEKKTDFFEDFSKYLDLPEITEDDIEDFTCDYINYVCPSCGESSAEPQDHCENCGSERPYKMHYKDNYSVNITLKPGSAAAAALPRSQEQIDALPGGALADFARTGKIHISYDRMTVRFETVRATDQLLALHCVKELTAGAELDFTGKFASLGHAGVSAELSDTVNYDFTWPGLSLDNETMTLEPGGTDNLIASLQCDDPTAYQAVWSSSDESVVSVDDEGYLKAGKQPGEAVVTASFEFGGRTFTDECVVNVRYAVESIRLSRRSLKLSVGETGTLSVSYSPAKATVKTARWYSEDESVATVDENGVVAAVGPGNTTVYALSDDGYFRSSCEVNVK